MSYWDTSALVKLYAPEPDSALFADHALALALPLRICRLGLYEARATFQRKEAAGLLRAGAAELLHSQILADVAAGDVLLTELDENLEREYAAILHECYQRTPPLPIRTLDAIHLAAARLTGATEVVATDKRVREVARFTGLSLFPA